MALQASSGAETVGVSGHGDTFEVVLKFLPFHSDSEVGVTAYVLDFATNEPIRGATVSGGLSSKAGADLTVPFTETTSGLPGAYQAKVSVAAGQSYSWLFDIAVGEKSDLVPVDGFKASTATGASNGVAGSPKVPMFPLQLRQWIALSIVTAALLAGVVLFARRHRASGQKERTSK
jgi:ABC-type branched-subunit amino acid transport system permease subunit